MPSALFVVTPHRLEIADAVGAVRGDACGVVFTCDNAYRHHVFQILLRVIRIQFERHERFKIRAHVFCGIQYLCLVFGNRLCARHGGNRVRHDDGAPELGYKVAYVAGHQVALAEVGMEIVG